MNTSHLKAETTLRRKSCQRGATLLESLAFLGIAALVILGAIALLAGAFTGADSNRGTQDVSTIRTGIKKLFAGQPSGYTSLTDSALIVAKVFPTTLTVVDANTVRNQWGGNVTATGTATSFSLTYNSVPQDVCVNLSTGNGEWTSVRVNGTTLATPVTPAQATTNCTGASNVIIWTGN